MRIKPVGSAPRIEARLKLLDVVDELSASRFG